MAKRHAAPEPAAAIPLAAVFTTTDHALPGTLARRFMRCGKTNCRCKADPPVLHGPYWHWTRTIAGKTQSRTLTEEQAQRYQPWFDNARSLRELLTDLEERSLQAFRDAEAPAP